MARQTGADRVFSFELCSRRCACIGCETVHFGATQTVESHSGWPWFTAPLADNLVNFHDDQSHGVWRIEATCSNWDTGSRTDRRQRRCGTGTAHRSGIYDTSDQQRTVVLYTIADVEASRV